MRTRVAWAVVALTTVAFVLDTVFTAAHRPLLSEATWADHGWPLAPLGGDGLRRDGGTHHLALPAAPAGLAAAGGEPALGDPGRGRLQHLGARRGRPRLPLLGSRRRLGGAAAGLAGVHRPDHRLPHRARRSPALSPLALGCVGRAGRPHPAHPRDADDPPRRVRGRRGLRQPGGLPAAPHRRLDARRSRTDRLGRLLGAAAAAGPRTTSGCSCSGSRRPLRCWRSEWCASWPSHASRARRGPGWPPFRCGSRRSPCPSAWPSRCCGID